MFNNVTTGYDMSDATWEIIIMLLVAFILGFILRHLFCKTVADDNSTANTQAFTSTEAPTPIPAAPAPAPIQKVVSAAPVEPERLQQVEGVGPKIEGLLHAGGILTMKQFATVDTNLVQKILNDAGPRYTMHTPKTWAKQAALIVDEKWDELKTYQDYLVGGREP